MRHEVQLTNKLLEEMLVWVKASSFASVKSLLETSLPSESDRAIYQLLSPDQAERKSAREIAKDLSVSTATISALVKRCSAMGLMKRVGKLPVRIFDLADFDLLPKNWLERSLGDQEH